MFNHISSCTDYLENKTDENESNLLNADINFEDKDITYWELLHLLLSREETSAIQNLQHLHFLVSDALKDISFDTANDITIEIILKLMHDSDFLRKHHNYLKQLLGDISVNSAEKMFKIVESFIDALSVDSLEFLDKDCIDVNCDIRLSNDMYVPNKETKEKLKTVRSFAFIKDKFSMLYDEDDSVNDSGAATSGYHWNKELLTNGFSQHENTATLEFCETDSKASTKVKQASVYNSGSYPSYGVQVTVQSQQEKELSKQMRKIEKKKQKNIDDEEYSHIQQDYAKASTAPLLKRQAVTEVNYPNVFDSSGSKYSKASIHGDRVVLPADIKRVDTSTYEEMEIKAQEKKAMPNLKNLVNIDNLDEISQIMFRGIKTLNLIQSLVFPTAYFTHENMLVCAPTGAGKTNVALLTIAHQIRQYAVDGVVDRSRFKIVYVAPMKALASEITANFNVKLNPLGILVRELTGDMQLTQREIKETQIIVTTPEKWDVITRKASSDNGISGLLKLLIIDEVHLLHGDRGPVIEALVARTLRQVESSQSMIRIIGLSATLPNYIDVAHFLKVNPSIGLFYFDDRFRPVPLKQIFVGVKPMKQTQVNTEMDEICYNKVVEYVRKGHQTLVFVHARNMTGHCATILKEKAQNKGELDLFQPVEKVAAIGAKRKISKASSSQLSLLLDSGFGIHHAGLLRTDRNLVEKCFREGLIRVLVTTSTLAWGVNLPAHAVIIRGTEIYDSKRGSYVDLDILDVLQIFGRAGRPQYDTSGTGIIITTHDKLHHYLRLLTHQIPIESSFLSRLPDHLNAEVVLGTVSNVDEALEWLSYTYLHQRLTRNVQEYGMRFIDLVNDPTLYEYRRKFICTAAQALDKARMIRYNARTGDFTITDLGRTASYYYIKYDTVQLFNSSIEPFMTEKEIFHMIANAEEFHQLKVRNDECDELESLLHNNCEFAVPGEISNEFGKVNVLMQTYLSRGPIRSFSLVSDMNYITQNVIRIARALFEITLHQNNPTLAGKCLQVAKMFELQQWDFQSPLRQFSVLSHETINKLEQRKFTIEELREEDVKSLGTTLRNFVGAELVQKCAWEFPLIDVESSMQPITRAVLRIKLIITANFKWNDKVHGKSAEAFWLWIEDPDNNMIYYSEHFLITKYNVIHNNPIELAFTVPLIEPLPSQYLARITNERWLRCSIVHSLSFRNLILPESYPPHTDLLQLQPLPVAALRNEEFQKLYTFTHFNPIQTQIFHCLYYTNHNILVGAPTGSGKTILSELAMLRLFKLYPNEKVVYIAPLKALVRERVQDWKDRFAKKLGKNVTELTGDVNPNIKEIERANIIITTPEKWDGLSRSWQSRHYVKKVGLMIIDEIHLLGEDRGPVLEVIVSRTNYIAANTNKKLRIIGLSTAMANAKDLASWLGIKQVGLYNFRSSVRPVPLEVHISGHPGKYYCPRMLSMNKPAFQAIRLYAPDSPSLIFVSSRRQTRLTALDMISFLANDTNPKQWLHMNEKEMEHIVSTLKDANLKLCLPFGIGIHHAGLQDRDRKTVEELFVNQKIQVLVATATLAWGVNFPAHLVVIKGTEYFDGKAKRYVDMPITDVLQMMGRAGRPQFDTSGVAAVLVHDIKKNFYKKFLYEPFPVESNLLQVMPDHINAEIVAGTICTKSDLLEYLTWTYFFQRLLQNPSYYNLPSLEKDSVNRYLDGLSMATFSKLIASHCIEFDEENQIYIPTPLGQIASYYYLSHQTMHFFYNSMKHFSKIEDLLYILSRCNEYAEFPLRHNEDVINSVLANDCRFGCDEFDSAHTKVLILLQAHFSRIKMPIPDYNTDLKSILEQAIRILQAMIDVAAMNNWLSCTLRVQLLLQMIIQGCWIDDSPFLILYDFDELTIQSLLSAWDKSYFKNLPSCTLFGIKAASTVNKHLLEDILSSCDPNCVKSVINVLDNIPTINISISVSESSDKGGQDNIDLDLINPVEVTVHSNTECIVTLKMKRIGIKSQTVAARHFPKRKDEGWFVNLGFADTDTLLALKRVSVYGQSQSKLTFITPSKPGNHILNVYFMSDSYIGIDQQYNIHLKVIA